MERVLSVHRPAVAVARQPREDSGPPGVPRKQFTKDQINEIARKYATEYR
jgi:hypothetical protein